MEKTGKADRSVVDTQEELKKYLVDIGICSPPQGKGIIAKGFKGKKITDTDGETFQNYDETEPDNDSDD